jgi:hypothetical protein
MAEELMGEPDTPRKSERGNSRTDSRLPRWLREPRAARQDGKLLEHIYDSYKWLRIGMAATALAFPILLWFLGKYIFGLRLQTSMSAYYWASSGGDPPVRVWFVGLIFAIGFFLILYKGYTWWEDWGLNLAAFFLIGVAVVPMCGSGVGQCPSWSVWHSRSAMAFFIFIALVAIIDSIFGFREIRASKSRQRFRYWYLAAGLLMIGLPGLAALGHHYLGRADTRTFWVEWFGIWAFSFYWVLRTIELHKSVAEGRAPNIEDGKWVRRGR